MTAEERMGAYLSADLQYEGGHQSRKCGSDLAVWINEYVSPLERTSQKACSVNSTRAWVDQPSETHSLSGCRPLADLLSRAGVGNDEPADWKVPHSRCAEIRQDGHLESSYGQNGGGGKWRLRIGEWSPYPQNKVPWGETRRRKDELALWIEVTNIFI